MAIPLIIGGALAAIGGIAGLGAAVDRKEAKETLERAQWWLDKHQKDMEKARKQTNSTLENLGRVRIEAEASQIARFLQLYSKIGKVDFRQIDGRMGRLSSGELQEMRLASSRAIEISDVGLNKLGEGVLAGVGAAGTAMFIATNFGVASTGTAITALSGVAATNATLAWLGGGAVGAAGGLGMAGGMVALGGLVAGPALAVIGFAAAGKAAEELTRAKRKEAEIDVICEQIKAGIDLLTMIDLRSVEIGEAIQQIAKRMDPIMDRVDAMLAEKAKRRPNAFSRFLGKKDSMSLQNFSEDEKVSVVMMASLAKALNDLLRVQVLEEDGSLNEESEQVVDQSRQLLAA